MLQSLMIMQKLLMMIQIMPILWQVGEWTWLKMLHYFTCRKHSAINLKSEQAQAT